jgi:hypothetical protein
VRECKDKSVDKNLQLYIVDTMIKVNENEVQEFSPVIRLACFMLANVTDSDTMIPSLDNKPMNSTQLSVYFNLDDKMFSKTYYGLMKLGIIASIITGGLECVLLNPKYFLDCYSQPITGFLTDQIFNQFNVFQYKENGYDEDKKDKIMIKQRMSQLRKLGYI